MPPPPPPIVHSFNPFTHHPHRFLSQTISLSLSIADLLVLSLVHSGLVRLVERKWEGKAPTKHFCKNRVVKIRTMDQEYCACYCVLKLEIDSREFWVENRNLFSETTSIFRVLLLFCFLTFLFLKPIAKHLVTVVKHVLLFWKQKTCFQNSNQTGSKLFQISISQIRLHFFR